MVPASERRIDSRELPPATDTLRANAPSTFPKVRRIWGANS
jgi:hypothetical protein